MDQQLDFDIERDTPNEKDRMLPSEGRGVRIAFDTCNIICNIITLVICAGFLALAIFLIIVANKKEE
jgi:hypothetical protein